MAAEEVRGGRSGDEGPQGHQRSRQVRGFVVGHGVGRGLYRVHNNVPAR